MPPARERTKTQRRENRLYLPNFRPSAQRTRPQTKAPNCETN